MGGKENDYSRKQQWKTKALFVLRHKEDRLHVGTYGIFIPYDQQSFNQASKHSKERKLDQVMRLWFLLLTSIFLQLTVSFYPYSSTCCFGLMYRTVFKLSDSMYLEIVVSILNFKTKSAPSPLHI